ncbi:endolytic transglycosylase MltG [Labilibaculum sp. DW002]|uniref:Endolytic murein transglycosylase n=1 Tax=Paralabilibaculum antarcticum TaxID=2912572 RepID=A0ABT5VXZ5_9BACT|nr:endolytic transglycosylase MltG [Labilibaculum sp. DW002]MDE5419383.1 endolytic transglycosylase MltG [Labilibaculum sp. DW002]
MINLFRLKDNRSKMWKIVMIAVMLVLVVTGSVLFKYYQDIFSRNIDLGDEEITYLYIPTNASQADVISLLKEKGYLKNAASLEWVMEKKNYAKHIHSGRFEIKNGICNNELVDLLRSGIQSPLNLTFNNTRTVEDFAGKIANQIEADSLSILTLLKDQSKIKKYGFETHTILAMFIPNTYQVYWNMSAEKFADKMHKEYSRYWNAERLKKAESIGLSPIEVSTLASIVDEETIKNDEKARVAGVYVNRLKRGIKLDADPTLKFAWGDFTMRRVLNKHKKIKSPYNTYKYGGLPPGPIRQASISGLNSVLNCENHKYIYFCASPEFNGYHIFAKSLREHNQNARKYQRALTQRGIMK